MSFQEISCQELQINPFSYMKPDCVLITAPDGDGVNPMTAGWGGLGVMWIKIPLLWLCVRSVTPIS